MTLIPSICIQRREYYIKHKAPKAISSLVGNNHEQQFFKCYAL